MINVCFVWFHVAGLSVDKHIGALFLHGNFHVYASGEFIHVFLGGLRGQTKRNAK